jgi:hypothetical protein
MIGDGIAASIPVLALESVAADGALLKTRTRA